MRALAPLPRGPGLNEPRPADRGPRQPRRNACCNHGHSADAAQARLLSETA